MGFVRHSTSGRKPYSLKRVNSFLQHYSVLSFYTTPFPSFSLLPFPLSTVIQLLLTSSTCCCSLLKLPFLQRCHNITLSGCFFTSFFLIMSIVFHSLNCFQDGSQHLKMQTSSPTTLCSFLLLPFFGPLVSQATTITTSSELLTHMDEYT